MLHEDHILVIGLNNDSQAAFGALYDKYAGKIYNYISLMLRDKILAEDFTQMCFLTVWERRAYIDPELSFSAYIYTIARNIIYKESRRWAINERYIDQAAGTTPALGSDADTSGLIERIDREIIDGELRRCITTLPEGRRRILELRILHNMSNAQVAEALNISVKTVEAQLTSAIKALRKNMGPLTSLVFLSLFL